MNSETLMLSVLIEVWISSKLVRLHIRHSLVWRVPDRGDNPRVTRFFFLQLGTKSLRAKTINGICVVTRLFSPGSPALLLSAHRETVSTPLPLTYSD